MGLLKQAGFIVAERHGRWMLYRCDEERIKVLITTFKNELTNTGSLSRARRRHGYHCHGCRN
jgi:DNA-binding transcriptional ArsR family regulator